MLLEADHPWIKNGRGWQVVKVIESWECDSPSALAPRLEGLREDEARVIALALRALRGTLDVTGALALARLLRIGH